MVAFMRYAISLGASGSLDASGSVGARSSLGASGLITLTPDAGAASSIKVIRRTAIQKNISMITISVCYSEKMQNRTEVCLWTKYYVAKQEIDNTRYQLRVPDVIQHFQVMFHLNNCPTSCSLRPLDGGGI